MTVKELIEALDAISDKSSLVLIAGFEEHYNSVELIETIKVSLNPLSPRVLWKLRAKR